MERRRFLAGSALAAFGGAFGSVPLDLVSARAAEGAGGGNQPKPPTAFTKAENAKYDFLPYDNKADFEDAARGFIAHLPDNVIVHDGKVVFNAKPFEIPVDAATPDTMNPSLWRICKLNGFSGLFKVADGLYQVRSIDIANMTIMECGEKNDGLIIIDCTQTAIAAGAALELYRQNVPGGDKRKVKAVIFTHSHVDHYGGVGGVTTPDEVLNGDVRIIAPENFTDEAVSENLYAGNAMFRRATYMYGTGLTIPPGVAVPPIGPGAAQTLGCGLGVLGASQAPTLFTPQKPGDWVTPDNLKMKIDDIEFEFLLVPGSEAPSEMHFFTPSTPGRKRNWLCTAENAVHTLHNFYTLRGAKTRDISKWVKYLNLTLDKWGDKAEVLYAPHHWPIWDTDKIVAHIENYRDAFKYIHDRALFLANSGYSLPQIGTMVKLPEALAKHWATRGYYGTVSHNARAIYNFYLGYFGGNPADLNPLPPPEASPRYVKLMGGASTVVKEARDAYDKGEYRWAAQLLEHVVYADPKNQEARNLQADAFEQLGYQAEGATWRNFYFVGAKELRNGVPNTPVQVTDPEYLAPNITLALTCEYVAIAVDSDKACNKLITINFKALKEKGGTDIEEERSLVLKNSVINSRAILLDKADVELTATTKDLNRVMLSGSVMEAERALKDGTIKAVGDEKAFVDVIALMTQFPFWFPIVTPSDPLAQESCKVTL
jgi:alkyl sulfatase BDS1-like metallo-beta-lactamase superfamily hydrolase